MPVIAASWKPRSPNSAAAASIRRRRVLRPRSVRGSLSPLALAALPKVAIGPPAREVEPVFSFAQAGRVVVDPSPVLYGRGGARREAVGGEGLAASVLQTLTSQASLGARLSREKR